MPRTPDGINADTPNVGYECPSRMSKLAKLQSCVEEARRAQSAVMVDFRGKVGQWSGMVHTVLRGGRANPISRAKQVMQRPSNLTAAGISSLGQALDAHVEASARVERAADKANRWTVAELGTRVPELIRLYRAACESLQSLWQCVDTLVGTRQSLAAAKASTRKRSAGRIGVALKVYERGGVQSYLWTYLLHQGLVERHKRAPRLAGPARALRRPADGGCAIRRVVPDAVVGPDDPVLVRAKPNGSEMSTCVYVPLVGQSRLPTPSDEICGGNAGRSGGVRRAYVRS